MRINYRRTTTISFRSTHLTYGKPFASGSVITMLAGHIALWNLAFLIESDTTRPSQSKQLDFPQLLLSPPNRSSAACITSIGGQMPHEYHHRIFGEDRNASVLDSLAFMVLLRLGVFVQPFFKFGFIQGAGSNGQHRFRSFGLTCD